MGIDAHLAHRCTIQRNVAADKDAYNNTAESWTVIAEVVHCRLVEDRETVAQSETAQPLALSTYTLLVLAGIDLADGDRITNVIYEDGSTDARTFKVTGVVKRRARVARHQSATLEVIG